MAFSACAMQAGMRVMRWLRAFRLALAFSIWQLSGTGRAAAHLAHAPMPFQTFFSKNI